jgi:hypothetical protein
VSKSDLRLLAIGVNILFLAAMVVGLIFDSPDPSESSSFPWLAFAVLSVALYCLLKHTK